MPIRTCCGEGPPVPSNYSRAGDAESCVGLRRFAFRRSGSSDEPFPKHRRTAGLMSAVNSARRHSKASKRNVVVFPELGGPTSDTYGATDSFSVNQVLITKAPTRNSASTSTSRQSARMPTIRDRTSAGTPVGSSSHGFAPCGKCTCCNVGLLAKAAPESYCHRATLRHSARFHVDRLPKGRLPDLPDLQSFRRACRPEARQSPFPQLFSPKLPPNSAGAFVSPTSQKKNGRRSAKRCTSSGNRSVGGLPTSYGPLLLCHRFAKAGWREGSSR